jgi:hypothetical protein
MSRLASRTSFLTRWRLFRRPPAAAEWEIAMTVASDRSGHPLASRLEESLPVAMLLSAAGGALDAFTWLAHGGVFANAQTGNVVLLGVYAALGQWSEALRHIPPIVAFVLGVFVAHRLSVHANQGASVGQPCSAWSSKSRC